MTRLGITLADLLRHLYVLGGTGVGKSRFLVSMFLSLVRSGCGLLFIDPHGEPFHILIALLAGMGRSVWERVILIDPLQSDWIVGFNPLELLLGEVAERRAQFLAGVVSTLWAVNELVAARMARVMFHTFWLLIECGLTLLEFADVLTDENLRGELLLRLPQTHKLWRYWLREFPTNDRLVSEWTQSSLNKVDELVTDPDIALMLGQRHSTIDFGRILDEGLILLVNLSKGQLVSRNSYLLGGLIVAQIQMAAFARAARPYQKHTPFILFADEFQNFVTEDIHEILAESRKYGLGTVLAHQYYGQLMDQPKLQQAVLNTVGSMALFRTGAQDAELFVRDIFRPEIDRIKDTRKRVLPTGIQWWPFMYEDEPVYRPLEETWEQEARRLVALKDREFWFKQRGSASAVKLRTPDMPDIARTRQLERDIERLKASARRWGRDRAAVQREIEARRAAMLTRKPPPTDYYE